MASAVKNSFYYTVGAIVKAAASFVLLPIFANMLGTEQYGIYNLLQTFSSILALFMTLATERSLYRLYYDYKTHNEKKEFLSTVFWSINIISIITIFIIWCFGKYIVQYFGDIDVYKVLLPVVLYTYIAALINYTQILLQVEQKGEKFLIVSLMVMITFNLVSIMFLLFYSPTVEALVFGNLFANFFILPLSLFYARRMIGLSFSFTILKSVLKYTTPMLIMVAFSWVLHATDRLFIGNMASMSDAGIYSLASKFVQLSMLLCGAVFQAYGPYFYKTVNTLPAYDAKAKIKGCNEILSLFIISTIVLVLIFSKSVLDFFFDEEYHSCLIYIYFLSLSCLFSQQSGMLNLMIYQNKKTVGLSAITIMAGIISVALNTTFIPIIGSIAAGISNLVVSIFMFAMTLILARRNYYIPIDKGIISMGVIIILGTYFLDSIITNIYVGLTIKLITCSILLYVYFKHILVNNSSMNEFFTLVSNKIKTMK